jgi:hypothetical protein
MNDYQKMKKVVTLVVLALLAVIAIVFQQGPSPVAAIENVSGSPVNIKLETDVGELYEAGTISSGGSVRMKISGRDKAIWAVAEFPDGRVLRSKEVYTTTLGTLSVRVGNTVVELRYEL